MIGLDTNVLVRIIFQDPEEPGQSDLARGLALKSIEDGSAIYINTTTLVETIWVFQSAYNASKAHLLRILEEIDGSPHFVLQNPVEVGKAIAFYKTGGGDFSDYLIGSINSGSDCETTYTFDRKLRNSGNFTLLEKV